METNSKKPKFYIVLVIYHIMYAIDNYDINIEQILASIQILILLKS